MNANGTASWQSNTSFCSANELNHSWTYSWRNEKSILTCVVLVSFLRLHFKQWFRGLKWETYEWEHQGITLVETVTCFSFSLMWIPRISTHITFALLFASSQLPSLLPAEEHNVLWWMDTLPYIKSFYPMFFIFPSGFHFRSCVMYSRFYMHVPLLNACTWFSVWRNHFRTTLSISHLYIRKGG